MRYIYCKLNNIMNRLINMIDDYILGMVEDNTTETAYYVAEYEYEKNKQEFDINRIKDLGTQIVDSYTKQMYNERTI